MRTGKLICRREEIGKYLFKRITFGRFINGLHLIIIATNPLNQSVNAKYYFNEKVRKNY